MISVKCKRRLLRFHLSLLNRNLDNIASWIALCAFSSGVSTWRINGDTLAAPLSRSPLLRRIAYLASAPGGRRHRTSFLMRRAGRRIDNGDINRRRVLLVTTSSSWAWTYDGGRMSI